MELTIEIEWTLSGYRLLCIVVHRRIPTRVKVPRNPWSCKSCVTHALARIDVPIVAAGSVTRVRGVRGVSRTPGQWMNLGNFSFRNR
jgi:hypothetical protein